MSARRAPKAKGKGKGKKRGDGAPLIRLPPEAPGPGRPSLLTDGVASTICAYLRMGLPRRQAAAKARIAEQTLHEWIARGEGRDRHDREPSPRLVAFAQEVRLAEADHTEAMLRQIVASGDPKVNMQILERRYRDDWHLSTRVEATVTHETGATLRDAIERIAAVVAEAEGEGDGGPEPR